MEGTVPTPKGVVVPKVGPEPTLLSRKEVDVLYELLDAVRTALSTLQVEYIVTGGSLLGAIRQHSILFCDDDIDIAIIDEEMGRTGSSSSRSSSVYERTVVPNLQQALGSQYVYQIRPWEGGDRVRAKRMNNVFLDLFVLRRYETLKDLIDVIGIKKNGQAQPESYVHGIVHKIQTCAFDDVPDSQREEQPLFPCWHFSARKAIEMWSKEVYRENELFPLCRDLKFGPLTRILGPRTPVRLLKRAFGVDCFEVYYQSASHKGNSNNNSGGGTVKAVERHANGGTSKVGNTPADGNGLGALLPLVSAGGTWEGGQKAPLEEEHYLPMQPTARALRRPTMHCKEQLMAYLETQTQLERSYFKKEKLSRNEQADQMTSRIRPNRTIYMDGVFDLFHIGHLEAINQCAELGSRVIIGVTGDEDATGYKRTPIVPQHERVAIVEALAVVDHVICPCPLIVTEAFLSEHDIDLVVHGFANDADAERQNEFFHIPMQLGKFQRIPYYQGLSTTDRISKIQRLAEEGAGNKIETLHEVTKEPSKPQWFGATLASATKNSPTIPTCPFPLELRIAIEPHIEKARVRRQEALDAIRMATGESLFDSVMSTFRKTLAIEGNFSISDVELRRSLLTSFYESVNLQGTIDLARLHEKQNGVSKDHLLHRLTQNPTPFQVAYDYFVREVCVPRFACIMDSNGTGETCKEVHYQAFPCLRIVQPNEFSIGPHADVAYGHHPCSVNFYMPLTEICGSSSIFLESHPGSEDWHSMEGGYGDIKHFAGAICLHWTTENKTALTRVSLDFRLVEGSMFESLKCGGQQPGGQLNVYHNTPGYYSRCVKETLNDCTV